MADCVICGRPIPPARKHRDEAKYCSKKCNNLAAARAFRSRKDTSHERATHYKSVDNYVPGCDEFCFFKCRDGSCKEGHCATACPVLLESPQNAQEALQTRFEASRLHRRHNAEVARTAKKCSNPLE